jgi:2-phospho-L-lactate/phosphoenolpyruvate guanylyltransferase
VSGGVLAVVPVRSLAGGKTRLAGVLTPEERETLVRAMLDHVLATVAASGVIDGALVVSPDPAARAFARERGAGVLAQAAAAPGLNAAIALGRQRALARRTGAALVLFADLPLLRPQDLRRLAADPAPVVLAPDRHGTGTNALLLRLTDGGGGAAFAPHFGEGSAAAHRAEAAARAVRAATVATPGVAFDLDTPEDWWAFLDIAPDVAERWGLQRAGFAQGAVAAAEAEAAW